MQKNGFSTERKVVFASMSKRNFYLREYIIRFIVDRGCTPLCAFMMFSYFLLDTVERKALIQANNDFVKISDELWVFGPISTGVKAEIQLAKKLRMPIRYFKTGEGGCCFLPIKGKNVETEER